VRRFAGLVVLLLGGCQLIFPLNGEEEPEPEPPETPLVNVRLVEAHVEHDSDAVPQLELLATTAAVTVFFEDRSSIEVDVAPDGTFSFVRTTQNYRLKLTRELDVFEVQDDAEMLAISYDTVGRIPQPLTSGTFISGPAPGPTTGTIRTMLATTGQWANPQLAPNATAGTVNWQAVEGLGNLPLGILDHTFGDRLYYLELAEPFVPKQTAISNFLVETTYTMTPSELHPMQGNLSPTTPAGCTKLELALPMELEEIKTAVEGYKPMGFATISPGWELKAQPSLEVDLGRLTVVQAPASTLELDVDVIYPNPFTDHSVVATAGAVGARPIQHPESSIAINVLATTEHLALPAGDCVAPGITPIDSAIGFPINVVLEATPLVNDGAKVKLVRPGRSRLTWETTDHPVDYFDVELAEIGVANGFTTTITTVQRYRTREPTLQLDNSTLEAGHFYVFTISPVLGVPDASQGDYTKRVFPRATASLPTAMFQAE
jgi:hypothetical protein